MLTLKLVQGKTPKSKIQMHNRNTGPESVCECAFKATTCNCFRHLKDTHHAEEKPHCDGSYYDCVVVITVVMLMVEEEAVEVGLLL